jgi:cAMP-dependent protein kinase regulator
LALLYNVPRAATIISKTDSILWQLDRETFNAIVKDSAIKKREKFEKFLKSVPILSSMDDYERSKIAESLQVKKFKKNEYIIRQV